jgi:SAM-dependent methyltransferase
MRKLLNFARMLRDLVYRVRYRGTGRWCPVCEKPSRRFAPFGVEKRNDALCVYCGALERHRLLWLFFQRREDMLAGRRFLHVAPERCLEPRLRQRVGPGYLTADLNDPAADVRMDVTQIQYPDASFDAIYCSHVLEHLPDDRRALREFHRVLSPDGWAIILVPITVARTIEDPKEFEPQQRLRRFGQDDHFRRYGPDFVDRLKKEGFRVEVVRVADLLNDTEATRLGLTPAAGDVYVCTK